MVLDKNDPFAAEMAALGPLEFDPASYCTGEQERKAKKRKPLTGIINEDTVARQFAKVYAGKLLYCHGRNAWYVWDGSLWQIDQTDQVFQWVRELTRQLCASEPKDRTRFVCNATRFAKGVEVFARSDPTFAVTAEAWDRDRFLLGTPDGTVDLETGKLRKSEPSDRITRSTAVAPSNHADCPLWLQFLEQATGGDADMIRLLQQWCGYALTGDTREHALVFVYGPGGNGKSVFLNTVTGILGDYATVAAMDTFTASPSRPASDGSCHAARRPTGDSFGDGGRSRLGGEPHQADDRRRPDHGPLHAAGLLHLPATLQAHDRRQSQAGAAQRRRCRSAALQHRPLRAEAGAARPPARSRS